MGKEIKFERKPEFFAGEYVGEEYTIRCKKCGKVLLQYLEPDQGLELMIEDVGECQHYYTSIWGMLAIESDKKSRKDFKEEEKKAVHEILNGDEIILIVPQ